MSAVNSDGPAATVIGFSHESRAVTAMLTGLGARETAVFAASRLLVCAAAAAGETEKAVGKPAPAATLSSSRRSEYLPATVRATAKAHEPSALSVGRYRAGVPSGAVSSNL